MSCEWMTGQTESDRYVFSFYEKKNKNPLGMLDICFLAILVLVGSAIL